MHHESCTDLFSVSERSPVVFQNLDGLNVYTQVPKRAPASCTTFLLCLCKSFKELFLQCLAQQVLSESGCKGTTFFRTCKLFRDFFRWKRKVFGLIDSITGYTLFIYKGKKQEVRDERREVEGQLSCQTLPQILTNTDDCFDEQQERFCNLN